MSAEPNSLLVDDSQWPVMVLQTKSRVKTRRIETCIGAVYELGDAKIISKSIIFVAYGLETK